jgi:hypothetical protein
VALQEFSPQYTSALEQLSTEPHSISQAPVAEQIS